MKTITDLIEREHGSRNWVLAKRTDAILRKYGADVVTLTQEQYIALGKRFDIEQAAHHKAYPILVRLMGNHNDAVNVIRALREDGFRIEEILTERAS